MATIAAAQELEITCVPRDAFYDPPRSIPSQPGTVIRSEELTGRQIPAGAQAWRILYSTTFANGKPETAVATILASTKAPAGPRPVIMFVHGTVGLVQSCMPSLWSQPFAGIPAIDQAIAAGWVIVATDYATEGQADSTHEYLIGEGEARSGLDSVRAAWQMKELKLDHDRTVVWGHSQGGGSALWVGMAGPRYAPDIKLLGVAAISPATYMPLILSLNSRSGAALLSWFMVRGFSHFYPDVKLEDLFNPAGQEGVRQLATVCPWADKVKTAQIFQPFWGLAASSGCDQRSVRQTNKGKRAIRDDFSSAAGRAGTFGQCRPAVRHRRVCEGSLHRGSEH